MPDYFEEIEDAQLLGIKPWELDEVPLLWRLRARAVNQAKKEARFAIAKNAKATAVYVVE